VYKQRVRVSVGGYVRGYIYFIFYIYYATIHTSKQDTSNEHADICKTRSVFVIIFSDAMALAKLKNDACVTVNTFGTPVEPVWQ
jgi:hypothetical protein